MSVLNKDGTSGLASDAAKTAGNLYKSMIDQGLTEPGVTALTREDVQNLFKQGRVGMMITAPFLANQIHKEAPNLNYGIVPIPAGTTQVTYGVTDSIVLFNNSKVKDEAWKVLEFLFRTDWRAKFDNNEGFLPVNAEEAKQPHFADSPDLKAFSEMLPHAKFAPIIAGWEQVADATVRNLQLIYLNKASVPQALQQAAEEANKALGK